MRAPTIKFSSNKAQPANFPSSKLRDAAWIGPCIRCICALTSAATGRAHPGRSSTSAGCRTRLEAFGYGRLETKTVIEHCTLKTSTRILHNIGVESKVWRVPHVRDAPQSIHPERSGGQRTARPTNPVVTERATLGHSKFCIGRRAFVRAGLRARLRPAPSIGRRGNCPSNCFWFTAQTRSRGGKVGRAVHCAPGWVVLTRLLEPESLPSAPLRARLRRGTLLVEKSL